MSRIIHQSHIDNLGFIKINPVSFWINSCPTAFQINTQVVLVRSQSEKSWFTPVSSPTVSHNPIFSVVLYSPSYNWNLVVWLWYKLHLFENTALISFKFLCGINTAWNWTSGKNFGFHISFEPNSFLCLLVSNQRVEHSSYIFEYLSSWSVLDSWLHKLDKFPLEDRVILRKCKLLLGYHHYMILLLCSWWWLVATM